MSESIQYANISSVASLLKSKEISPEEFEWLKKNDQFQTELANEILVLEEQIKLKKGE